jgi:DNA-binding response OmpR family regulator
VPEKHVVLAVDDEKQLLRLLADYLGRLGYAVRACGSATEALEAFREAPGAYSAALVDRHLPGMSGDELVAELRKLNPGLGVIVLSGYAQEADALTVDSSGRTRFLQKPFAPGELARLVESLCGR